MKKLVLLCLILFSYGYSTIGLIGNGFDIFNITLYDKVKNLYSFDYITHYNNLNFENITFFSFYTTNISSNCSLTIYYFNNSLYSYNKTNLTLPSLIYFKIFVNGSNCELNLTNENEEIIGNKWGDYYINKINDAFVFSKLTDYNKLPLAIIWLEKQNVSYAIIDNNLISNDIFINKYFLLDPLFFYLDNLTLITINDTNITRNIVNRMVSRYLDLETNDTSHYIYPALYVLGENETINITSNIDLNISNFTCDINFVNQSGNFFILTDNNTNISSIYACYTYPYEIPFSYFILEPNKTYCFNSTNPFNLSIFVFGKEVLFENKTICINSEDESLIYVNSSFNLTIKNETLDNLNNSKIYAIELFDLGVYTSFFNDSYYFYYNITWDYINNSLFIKIKNNTYFNPTKKVNLSLNVKDIFGNNVSNYTYEIEDFFGNQKNINNLTSGCFIIKILKTNYENYTDIFCIYENKTLKFKIFPKDYGLYRFYFAKNYRIFKPFIYINNKIYNYQAIGKENKSLIIFYNKSYRKINLSFNPGEINYLWVNLNKIDNNPPNITEYCFYPCKLNLTDELPIFFNNSWHNNLSLSLNPGIYNFSIKDLLNNSINKTVYILNLSILSNWPLNQIPKDYLFNISLFPNLNYTIYLNNTQINEIKINQTGNYTLKIKIPLLNTSRTFNISIVESEIINLTSNLPFSVIIDNKTINSGIVPEKNKYLLKYVSNEFKLEFYSANLTGYFNITQVYPKKTGYSLKKAFYFNTSLLVSNITIGIYIGNYDSQNTKVFYCKDSNWKDNNCVYWEEISPNQIIYAAGFLYIKTNHFSTYAIFERKQETTPSTSASISSSQSSITDTNIEGENNETIINKTIDEEENNSIEFKKNQTDILNQTELSLYYKKLEYYKNITKNIEGDYKYLIDILLDECEKLIKSNDLEKLNTKFYQIEYLINKSKEKERKEITGKTYEAPKNEINWLPTFVLSIAIVSLLVIFVFI